MYHLAQVNVATAKGAIDSDLMHEFVDNLDPINALAESFDGFIWRLKDQGGNATDIVYSDNPNEIVNMSVWQSVPTLKEFMFKSHHLHFLKRKKEWFETAEQANYALWWVPVGHRPSIEEAKVKLAMLRKEGDSIAAFSFKNVFASPSI